jgi:choline-sulfatase
MLRLMSLSFALCFFQLQPLGASEQPNVLFIAADDLNDWIGCLKGHPQVKTPNLDRLASRGMLFTNAHCQAPLCNPSRTSILTGLRPSTTGIHGLAPWIRTVPAFRDVKTLPEHFTKNGYQSATVGKIWHGGYPPLKERNREFQIWGPAGGTGVRPKEKLVTTPSGNHPLVDWGTFPHRDEEKGDYQVATWAVEQLKKFDSKKPFFLAVGFFLPHVPCHVTQKWFDMYPEESLQLPPVLENDRDDCPDFSWYLHWKLPEVRLSWLKQANQWKPLVRSYLASISFMDAQVGRVLDALEKNGQEQNTIVIFWSDHGWHLGEKGITGKNSLWERSTRVPLIFAGPSIPRNQRCVQPVELLDLFPTLIDLCRLPKVEGLEGHSLQPQLKDSTTTREWPAITTHNRGNHSIRSLQYRLIRYGDGSEEFYDLKADPNEWKNLAKSDAHQALMAQHRKWLPKIDVEAALGSKERILQLQDGRWIWEGKPIVIGELEK